MYAITGATGQVGSATADRLLAAGAPVRVVARDAAKAAPWADRGAEVAVADLGDRAGLGAALAGSDGAFVLLPFDLAASDFHAQARAQVEAIAGAVADSGVPHVVALSSIGAQLADGTGPIVALHHLEEALRGTGTVVSAVRACHFQESVAEVLEPARAEGILPVFADSADEARPMVATRDVGGVIASCLQAPPSANEVIDVEGPDYTDRQIAEVLGRLLGRDLEVVIIPRADWVDALVGAGFPAHLAEVLVGLYEAGARGILTPEGDRIVHGTTPLETTLAGLVGVPA